MSKHFIQNIDLTKVVEIIKICYYFIQFVNLILSIMYLYVDLTTILLILYSNIILGVIYRKQIIYGT